MDSVLPPIWYLGQGEDDLPFFGEKIQWHVGDGRQSITAAAGVIPSLQQPLMMSTFTIYSHCIPLSLLHLFHHHAALATRVRHDGPTPNQEPYAFIQGVAKRCTPRMRLASNQHNQEYNRRGSGAATMHSTLTQC